MNYSIEILVVGKIKEEFYRNKIQDFCKSINRYAKININELADESIPQNAGEAIMEKIKEKEGEKILDQISNRDYVVVLCIDGKLTDSEELKRLFRQCNDKACEKIIFVIGGSLGLHESVVRRANYRLSFSRMTFPHQLMRVMLLEQIADTICGK